ncbi:hypothetical protein [Pelagibacterium sediminicola]|uniref:hypothetical protein n=1 Tax=Pelagibacterium sediminicola TaxID=2248761 RepID=UPI000E30D176|nr:hypothetical protein [Pelagibacterium sediminicola]
MNKILPIALFALGLILAFTVLAAAKTPDSPKGGICIEETISTPVAETGHAEPKAMRCWKKLRTGLAVTSCGPEPVLGTQAPLPATPPAVEVFSGATFSPTQCDGPELDLPPPRA